MRTLGIDSSDIVQTKSLSANVVTKSDNYTLTIHDFVVLGNATTKPLTFTLQPNTSNWYRVKKIDATTNTVTVTTSNSKLIEGSNNLTITNQGNSVDLMLDESGNWWVF